MTGQRGTQSARVLVAGVGNIFLGDDGFGVEVARRLKETALPDGVQVGDYGTSGMHLAYDLADHGYQTTILIDAAPRGETPGTLTVLEVRPEDRASLATAGGPQLFNGHGMQPEVVLGVLDMLGAEPGRILVVACEPASAGPGMSLSAPVGAAVTEAVALVTRLVTEATGPPAFGQMKTEPERTESDARAMVAPPARSED
jgi:hydrogenase maturation protease